MYIIIIIIIISVAGSSGAEMLGSVVSAILVIVGVC